MTNGVKKLSECNKNVFVPQEELQLQREYTQKAKTLAKEKYSAPKAIVRTFGCQQNVP